MTTGRCHSDPDVQEVVCKELRLLEPDVRASTEVVISLLHQEFREFGASGSIWDRRAIATALAGEPPVAISVSEMHGIRLADDVVLVTYLAQAANRTTLRSSVWLRCDDGWRLFFHQGTVRNTRIQGHRPG